MRQKLIDQVTVCHLGQEGSVFALVILPGALPLHSSVPATSGHPAEPARVTVAHRRSQREAPAREPGLARRDHGSGCYSWWLTALADSGSVTPSGRRIGEVTLHP